MQLNKQEQREIREPPWGDSACSWGAGRTTSCPVYPASWDTTVICPLPAQESPRLLVPSQVGSSPPMRGAFPAAGQGFHLWGLLFQRKQTHPIFSTRLTAQPLPGIRGLSCRAQCFPLMHCPLPNDNDNGNHIY